MKNTVFTLCNESIYPGEQLSLALALPELLSCAPLYMPIKVIHGNKSGPVLLLTAAMHGNELNGTEIINCLIENLSPKKIMGTLIAVPVLNVYGLISRSRYLPGGIDLNSCFPGGPNGSHAARIANLFITEIFNKVDYCIDLQTGFINYSNLPQVYVDFNHAESRELAEVFNAPVVLNMREKPGSLHECAKKMNKPFLHYEAGEAMRFDSQSIKSGLNGIYRVMRKLNMIADKSTQKTKQKSFFANESIWIRASCSGVSHSKYKLGQHVKKNEVLCIINDPFGATEGAIVHSPVEGIIIGKNNLPLIQEGEGLFQLAIFSGLHQEIADDFQSWKSNASIKNDAGEFNNSNGIEANVSG